MIRVQPMPDPKEQLAARDAKIAELRQKLKRMKFKLDLAKMHRDDIEQDHLELWEKEYRGRYNLNTPSEEILSHIAYKRDLDQLPGLVMLRRGYMIARKLKTLFVEEGFDDLKSVLDFGSGPGRVARFLDCLGSDTKVFGCDIDGEAIDWAQGELPETYFVSNDRPPLPLPDAVETFGGIVVLSVFTHLPEDMQFEWLEELANRLEPGALMMATFHGPSYYRFIPEADREIFERDGFVHSDLGKTPDLPDYYLSTFHSYEYVEKNWTKHFRLRRIVAQEVNDQDVAILEKK